MSEGKGTSSPAPVSKNHGGRAAIVPDSSIRAGNGAHTTAERNEGWSVSARSEIHAVRDDNSASVPPSHVDAECETGPFTTESHSTSPRARGQHHAGYVTMDYRILRRQPVPCPRFHSPSEEGLYIEPTVWADGLHEDRTSCGSRDHPLYQTADDAPSSPEPESPQQPESEQRNILSRTVQFRVTQSAFSPDVIWQYFDSLNLADGGGEGGGCVEFITVQNDQMSAQVTFTSKETAHRVVLGHHTINGETVKIKPCIPPRRKPPAHDLTYPDKCLFKDVPENISQSLLELYLEVVSKARPVEVLYGDDPGVVVVTFDQHPDLATVQKECERRLFDGKVQLSVSPVPVSLCVLVEGLGPGVTEDTVRRHFEGLPHQDGLVERVVMQQSGATQRCFVHFHEPTAVDSVLAATPHIIDRQEVRVRPYLECLGPSGGSTDPSHFPLPPALILKVDKRKRALILQSPEAADLFNEHLSQVHAAVHFLKDTLKFVCTLTTRLAIDAGSDTAHTSVNYPAHAPAMSEPASLNSFAHAASGTGGCMRKRVQRGTLAPRQIVQNWVGNVRQVVNQFFEQVHVLNVSVPEEVWEEVKGNLETKRIPWPAKTTYALLEEDSACAVVGVKPEAREFAELIDQRVKALEEQNESKPTRVTVTHIKLKPYELRLLEAKSFDEELKGKYRGLDVELDPEKNDIIFSGLAQDIKHARFETYHLVKSIKSTKISRFAFSSTQKAMLGAPETEDFVDAELKSFGFTATWRRGTHEDVTVYAFLEEDLNQAVQIIQQAVFEEEIANLDPEYVEKLLSNAWQNHAEALLSRHRDSVKVRSSPDKRKMVITGRRLVVQKVKAELIRSFSEHAH